MAGNENDEIRKMDKEIEKKIERLRSDIAENKKELEKKEAKRDEAEEKLTRVTDAGQRARLEQIIATSNGSITNINDEIRNLNEQIRLLISSTQPSSSNNQQNEMAAEIQRIGAQMEAAKTKLEMTESKLEYLQKESTVNILFQAVHGCGSEKMSKKAKSEVRAEFGGECWICGAADPSVAHIIPCGNDIVEIAPDALSLLDDSYDEPFEWTSQRNMIALCGDKNTPGTCHYHYDNHNWTIVYIGLDVAHPYHVLRFREANGRPTNEPLRNVQHQPYRRALAKHAFVTRSRYLTVPEDCQQTLEWVQDMEAASSAHSQLSNGNTSE